ncbi:MAG: flagellar assembly protein FliW [Spirochaetaceae bacterium]|nr:flagellar assembly protein FliW [Spirochaetaceae bacterium]
MKLETKSLGIINIDDTQRVYFSKGIFGFENIKEYALLNANQWPFYWLQAIEVPDLAFVLIEPIIFRADYDPDVDSDDLAELELTPAEKNKTLIYAIVTVPADPKRMTANLQGPIIINKELRIGRQLISLNKKWQVKHYIIDELSSKEGTNAGARAEGK